MFLSTKLISRLVLTTAALITLAAAASADWDFGAKYGGEFMTLGSDARSSAMGETGTAFGGSAASAYWNPAALASLQGGAFTAMHADRFAGVVKYDFLSAAQKYSPTEAAAVTLYRLGVDDIPITVLQDPTSPLSVTNPVIVRRWTADAEMAVIAAYAFQRTPQLSLGASAKLLSKKVGYNQALGIGFDAGAIYQVSRSFYAGARLADITTTYLGWDSGHNEIIFPTMSAGVLKTFALPRLEADLTLTADVILRTENRGDIDQFAAGPFSGEARFGMEYTIERTLSLRGGFDSDNFTAGAGLRIAKINLDYAYQSHADLGASHRVSLSYSWKRNIFAGE